MPPEFSSTERPFLDAIRSSVLVIDGAMGTQLYERGVLYSACFEELNATRPELVAKVHEDYIRAGAQVIETNTFGANALRLEKFGLQARVRELNLAGVRVARQAAGSQAYVAGALGPSGYFLGEADAGDLAKVRAVFAAQAAALVEGGVDVLLVETLRQTPELRVAVEAAVEAAAGRIPVIASVSLDDSGRMAEGTEAEEVARLAREWGASIVGANCSDGPMAVLAAVEKMAPVGLPILAAPGRALPRITRAVRYEILHKYIKAHVPELRNLGADFPSRERFDAYRFAWLDFALVGEGRLLVAFGRGEGGLHVFWFGKEGFQKSALFDSDPDPEPRVELVGDKLRVHVTSGVHEVMWWGP